MNPSSVNNSALITRGRAPELDNTLLGGLYVKRNQT